MQSQHVTSNDWLYSTKKNPNPSSISIPQLAGITFQLRVGQEHIAQRSPGTHSWKIDGGSNCEGWRLPNFWPPTCLTLAQICGVSPLLKTIPSPSQEQEMYRNVSPDMLLNFHSARTQDVRRNGDKHQPALPCLGSTAQEAFCKIIKVIDLWWTSCDVSFIHLQFQSKKNTPSI